MIELACDGSNAYHNCACFSFMRDGRTNEYVDFHKQKRLTYRIKRTTHERDEYIKQWVSLANWELDDYEMTSQYHIFDKKFYNMRDRLIFFGFAHMPRVAQENDDMMVGHYWKLRNEADVTPDDAFILMNFVTNMGQGHMPIGTNIWIKTLKDWKWQKWIDYIAWDIPAAQGYYQQTLVNCGGWLDFFPGGEYFWMHNPPNFGVDKDLYLRLKTETFYQPYRNGKDASEGPVYRPISD